MRKMALIAALALIVGAVGGSIAPAPAQECDALAARQGTCKAHFRPLGLGYDAGGQGCVDGSGGCHPAL
jgi:hypothetical protein